MKEKIVELLKHGLSNGVVARACGVDPSYVSQVAAEEGVNIEIAEAKIANVEKSVALDNMIDDVEQRALQRVSDLLPFCARPESAARIFQTLNSAKKRTAEVSGLNTNPTAPLVNINISMQAAVAFRLSSDKQVVEVDGRSMATLPAKQLTERLKERREAIPLISDAKTAGELLNRIEQGIPADSLAHVL